MKANPKISQTEFILRYSTNRAPIKLVDKIGESYLHSTLKKMDGPISVFEQQCYVCTDFVDSRTCSLSDHQQLCSFKTAYRRLTGEDMEVDMLKSLPEDQEHSFIETPVFMQPEFVKTMYERGALTKESLMKAPPYITEYVLGEESRPKNMRLLYIQKDIMLDKQNVSIDPVAYCRNLLICAILGLHQEGFKICLSCSKECQLQCKSCFKAFYCSVVCQKKDWKVHKLICSFLKEAHLTIEDSSNIDQYSTKGHSFDIQNHKRQRID